MRIYECRLLKSIRSEAYRGRKKNDHSYWTQSERKIIKTHPTYTKNYGKIIEQIDNHWVYTENQESEFQMQLLSEQRQKMKLWQRQYTTFLAQILQKPGFASLLM